MLAQTLNRFLILIDYQLNKEYITNTLCENRDKPMMHCNGKCRLMKKMQQAEKKEQAIPNGKPGNNSDVDPYFSQYNMVSHTGIIITAVNGKINSTKPVDRAFPVFHPPPAL